MVRLLQCYRKINTVHTVYSSLCMAFYTSVRYVKSNAEVDYTDDEQGYPMEVFFKNALKSLKTL